MKIISKGKNDIKIYFMDITISEQQDREAFGEYYAAMPSFRREKVDRFRKDTLKRQSIGAFALLMRALYDAGMTEKSIDKEVLEKLGYATGTYGKPYFSKCDNLHFSLSHSGDMVMCTLAGRQVGCDIEQIKAKNIFGIYERFFSEKEKVYLNGIGDEKQRNAMFYRMWTVKEAYTKMLGEGIKIPFDSFEVSDRGGKLKIVEPNGVYTEELTDISGYAASVCLIEN